LRGLFGFWPAERVVINGMTIFQGSAFDGQHDSTRDLSSFMMAKSKHPTEDF